MVNLYTTTRILHFIAFWCKLAVLFLNLTRVNNFKWESKNEMNCGSCSQKSSLWKCGITRFTQTFFQTTFSIAQKEAAHLMNPTHWENLILCFFYVFHKKEKKKQSTWFVCKWELRRALKPVYFTYFMPNLSTLEEQLVQSTTTTTSLNLIYKACPRN